VCVYDNTCPRQVDQGWLTEHWIRREHLFHLPQELGTIYEGDAGDFKELDPSVVTPL